MKYIITSAVLIFINIAIISCTKELISPQNSQISIIGRWNIVNDSLVSGIGSSGYSYENYVGLAGDYFDFRSDGYVYIKEGNALDTLSYQLQDSNKIIIESFGFIINGVATTSDITILTAHNFSIRTNNDSFNNPAGGVYRRFVDLSR